MNGCRGRGRQGQGPSAAQRHGGANERVRQLERIRPIAELKIVIAHTRHRNRSHHLQMLSIYISIQ